MYKQCDNLVMDQVQNQLINFIHLIKSIPSKFTQMPFLSALTNRNTLNLIRRLHNLHIIMPDDN